MITIEEIREALQAVRHPEYPAGVLELGMIRDIALSDEKAVITIALPFMNVPVKDDIVDSVTSAVSALEGAGEVGVDLVEMTAAEKQRFMEAFWR